MIEIKLSYKPGCVLFYVMHCEEGEFYGGIDKDMRLFVSQGCPYRELMLRTLINKCMDTDFPRFTTEDVWGVPLEQFGFAKEGEVYAAAASALSLPDPCKTCK